MCFAGPTVKFLVGFPRFTPSSATSLEGLRGASVAPSRRAGAQMCQRVGTLFRVEPLLGVTDF